MKNKSTDQLGRETARKRYAEGGGINPSGGSPIRPGSGTKPELDLPGGGPRNVFGKPVPPREASRSRLNADETDLSERSAERVRENPRWTDSREYTKARDDLDARWEAHHKEFGKKRGGGI